MGFGLKKLRMRLSVGSTADAASAEEAVSAWAEYLAEQLEEEEEDLCELVQSFDVVEGETAELEGGGLGRGSLHLGLREPHKRYQNSFTVFQKRAGGFAEPIFSWGP